MNPENKNGNLLYLCAIAFAVTTAICVTKFRAQLKEPFVAANDYEAPDATDGTWTAISARFGRLVQSINASSYAQVAEPNKLVEAFQSMINTTEGTTFRILSVGRIDHITLYDVVIQDTATQQTTRFPRVDFVLSSMNPITIQKIIVTPSADARVVCGVSDLSPAQPLELRNQLHLFSPFRTSQDD